MDIQVASSFCLLHETWYELACINVHADFLHYDKYLGVQCMSLNPKLMLSFGETLELFLKGLHRFTSPCMPSRFSRVRLCDHGL